MTSPSDEDAVGYGRPPKHTRWKKGQSGNTHKVRPPPAETMVTLIDRLLLAPVKIVKNGVPTRMTAINAIIHQLLQKSLSGNPRAERALREFEVFAIRNQTQQPEIVFVDNPYSAAFSASRSEEGNV